MLVIIKHNGQCGQYQYTKGQEIDLPEDVLKALDAKDYEVVAVTEVEDKSLPVQATTAIQSKKKNSK